MAEAASDLKLLFSGRPDDPHWVEAELGEEIEEMKAAVTKLPGVAWTSVSEEIGEKVEGLLNIDVADVLCSAWSKYRLLQQFRDRNKYGPEETILVPLAKHSVKSVHHPSIEIVLNDLTVGRLEFEINLRLDLEGVVLKVRDAKIWEIKSGRCAGTGVCKCGSVTLLTKKTPQFDLPGRVKLDKPFDIPTLDFPRDIDS